MASFTYVYYNSFIRVREYGARYLVWNEMAGGHTHIQRMRKYIYIYICVCVWVWVCVFVWAHFPLLIRFNDFQCTPSICCIADLSWISPTISIASWCSSLLFPLQTKKRYGMHASKEVKKNMLYIQQTRSAYIYKEAMPCGEASFYTALHGCSIPTLNSYILQLLKRLEALVHSWSTPLILSQAVSLTSTC